MGPTKESLALADALIAEYGLKAGWPNRRDLAYSIMDHESRAEASESPE